jgi:hypothetical protein
MPVIPVTAGGIKRRIVIQASPAKMQDPIQKVTIGKGLGMWLKK